MRTPLAHSARKNYPPQTYEAHVRGVCERAGKYAAEAECYSVKANGILSTIVRDSALLHDLGKLEERKPGERLFPEDAGDLLKRKRQLSALQNRLHEAAEAENYEEAARLRDDIAVIEKEVYSHENCTGSV